MRKFSDLRGRVVRLAFTPEGKTLVAAVRGGMQLGLWDWPAGTFRQWHPYIDDAVSGFAYSPDGKWLVVGGEIGLALPYIRAKDSYDSEMHSAWPVEGLAFSSRVVRGHTVLAMGSRRVRLFDLDAPYTDKKAIWDVEMPSTDGRFRSVAFHPTADVLVGCDTENRFVSVWNPVKRDQLHLVFRTSAPTAAVFSTSGRHLMVAYGGHSQLLETEKWETVAVCRHGHGRVTDIAASACGRWFATSGTDETVRFWDATTGKLGRVFSWRFGSLTAVVFSPDGLTCAAGTARGEVVVWDMDT